MQMYILNIKVAHFCRYIASEIGDMNQLQPSSYVSLVR